MKNYRNAAAALTLAFVLASPAKAGVMHTGIAGPDPEPTPTAEGVIQTGATEGEMPTDGATSTPEALDAVTTAALNLLQSVLTLI